MSQTCQVRNWKSYNKALKKRGDLFFYFDEGFFQNQWRFKGKQKPGGEIIYSDAAIEMLLFVKHHFRLALRQTQGFVESLLKKFNVSAPVPDYSTLSRRSKTLPIKIRTYGKLDSSEPLHLLIDSTGLSVYSSTYFHAHKYLMDRLKKTGQSWKKLHIAFDLVSAQVVSAHLSDSHIQDASALPILTELHGKKIASIRADKAYDKRVCRRRAEELNALAIIPPIKVARLQNEIRKKNHEKALESRDQAIRFIRQHENYEQGVKEWKKSVDYHKRSRIEALNKRFKQAFGHSLSSKHADSRQAEIIVKLSILNKQTTLGSAIYERIT